jgi:hypothetical protein
MRGLEIHWQRLNPGLLQSRGLLHLILVLLLLLLELLLLLLLLLMHSLNARS